VKERSRTKISFSQFVDAIGLVADRLQRNVMDVVKMVVSIDGPIANATRVSVRVFLSSSMRSSFSASGNARPATAKGSLRSSVVNLRDSTESINSCISDASQGMNKSEVTGCLDKILKAEESPAVQAPLESAEDDFSFPADVSQPVSQPDAPECEDPGEVLKAEESPAGQAPLKSHEDNFSIPAVLKSQPVVSKRALTPSKNDLSIDSRALLKVFAEFASFGKGISSSKKMVPPIKVSALRYVHSCYHFFTINAK